jgi:hypothetical protein
MKAKTSARPASCNVIGTVCSSSSITGALSPISDASRDPATSDPLRALMKDVPRSPRATRPSQWTYCTGIGSRRPMATSVCSTTALLAIGPRISRAGSPGARRRAAKIAKDTIRTMITPCANRRMRKVARKAMPLRPV